MKENEFLSLKSIEISITSTVNRKENMKQRQFIEAVKCMKRNERNIERSNRVRKEKHRLVCQNKEGFKYVSFTNE